MIEFIRRQWGYAMPRLGHLAFNQFFRFYPDETTTELFPGVRVKMNFRDESCRVTWWMGDRYEQPLPALLRSLCAEDVDTFYDVGANYGFFSYLILAYCQGVRVFSFEPNPNNFATLQETKARNSLAHFFPQNVGLGDAAGDMELLVEMESSGHSIFGTTHPDFDLAHSKFNRYRIPVQRFDDWLASCAEGAPRRAVLKMDVEGFEVRALSGMAMALQKKLFKALVIEVYAATLQLCSSTPEELGRYLAGFGYLPHDTSLQPTTIRSDDQRNLVFLPG